MLQKEPPENQSSLEERMTRAEAAGAKALRQPVPGLSEYQDGKGLGNRQRLHSPKWRAPLLMVLGQCMMVWVLEPERMFQFPCLLFMGALL